MGLGEGRRTWGSTIGGNFHALHPNAKGRQSAAIAYNGRSIAPLTAFAKGLPVFTIRPVPKALCVGFRANACNPCSI